MATTTPVLPSPTTEPQPKTAAGRVQTAVRTGTPLSPPPIPASWRAAPAWSLVPVAGEIHGEWARVVPDEAFVTVGWQGLLRQLVAGEDVARLPPTDTKRLGATVGAAPRTPWPR